MKVNDKAFYELMGDYHWDMCGYYCNLFHIIMDESIAERAKYHQKQHNNYWRLMDGD